MKKRYKTDRIFLIIGSLLFSLILLGASLNFFAVLTNGWRMPVKGTGVDTNTHFWFYGNEKVRLIYLTDIFDVGSWMISVGDILILISALLFCLIYLILLYREVKKRRWGKKT